MGFQSENLGRPPKISSLSAAGLTSPPIGLSEGPSSAVLLALKIRDMTTDGIRGPRLQPTIAFGTLDQFGTS